jgi:hypothetical protein
MVEFVANVNIQGEVENGDYVLTLTQISNGGTPPVDPPETLPPEDNWVQPPPPPQPPVQPGSSGRILRAKDYGSIAAAIAAAAEGDTITVAANAAREAFTITKIVAVRADNVVWDFNGVPSGQLAGGGKAAIVPASAACIISGFEISGCGLDAPDGELTAALRNESAGWCTVENCHFHHNQNGIASGYYNAVMEVRNTKLIGNGLNSPGHGGRGNTHNLYVNQINELTLIDVESTGPIDGHALKFRGYRLIIDGGFYESTVGRSLDMPNGGKFTIKNATLNKPSDASNGTMLGYMSEYRDSGESNENTLESCVINANRQGSNEIHTMGGVITFAPDNTWSGRLTVTGSGTVAGLPA